LKSVIFGISCFYFDFLVLEYQCASLEDLSREICGRTFTGEEASYKVSNSIAQKKVNPPENSNEPLSEHLIAPEGSSM